MLEFSLVMPGFGLPHRHPDKSSLRSKWLSSVSVFASFGFVMALTSCGMVQTSIEAKRAGGEKTSITKVTPIAARPNEVVKLTGSNFHETKNLKVSLELTNGESATVPLTITDSKTASFTMPEGAGLGLKDVKLTQGTAGIEVTRFNLIADQASNQLPIWIGEASEICGGKKYIDRNGDQQTGTKDCAASSVKACESDGDSNCVVDGTTYKAAKLSNITASDLLTTKTIAGITGTAVAPDPWDVRVGKTINGVAGKLKVNCRNRVNSSIYNYDGAIGSIGTSGVTSGTAIDIWDTIDDYNNYVSGLPPSVVTVWGNDTDCGGVDTTASSTDDDNVWKDVTTTNGLSTNPSTCAVTSVNCTMQDKITGLWWSKLQASGAWNTAWNTCVTTLNNTTYSGISVAGYNGQTGWRLPTQKELMEAYTHGIRSAASTNWMTEANMISWFWSGSSVSYDTPNAWIVNLAYGNTTPYAIKYGAYQVVCVR